MAPFSSCEGIDLELFDVQQTNGKMMFLLGACLQMAQMILRMNSYPRKYVLSNRFHIFSKIMIVYYIYIYADTNLEFSNK